MCRITSVKDLKGLPFRSGGGFDWSPTLATMSGCVQIVARDFERAPSTSTHVSISNNIQRTTFNLQNDSPGLKVFLPG